MKLLMLKIVLCLILLSFNLPAFAYDDEAWKKIPDDNSDFVQCYEKTFTLKIVLIGSMEKFRSEWFEQHGTRLKERTVCQSVAGAGTIPEIWIQAKVINGEVWPHISCFGHEFIHILKTLGLRVVNPNRNIE